MKKSIITKTLFSTFFYFTPVLLFAQDLEGQTDKIVSLIIDVVNIVTGGIAIIMVAFIGIKYMTTKDDERGEGAASKLKSGLLKVVLGAGIVFSATTLANYIIDGLK